MFLSESSQSMSSKHKQRQRDTKERKQAEADEKCETYRKEDRDIERETSWWQMYTLPERNIP